MDYDTKLGEWFKQVEKKAEELRARRTAAPSVEQELEGTGTPEPISAPEHVKPSEVVSEPMAQAAQEMKPEETVSNVATAEKELEQTETTRDLVEPAVSLPGLFEETEVPPVEDFLSFLSRTEHKSRQAVEEPVDIAETEVHSESSMLGVSEGTGEPRPITPPREPEPVAQDEAVVQAQAPAAAVEPPKPIEAPAAGIPKQRVKLARFPQQLQSLLQSAQDEVAQNSYKAFKESRAGLIERLLDPPLTLEEAARILNVCPTTVRRYTNRGILKHFRTAGNQRRFRLSDVLAFMETQLDGAKPVADEAL